MLSKKQKEMLKKIKKFEEISSDLWLELNEENKSSTLEKDIRNFLEERSNYGRCLDKSKNLGI